MGSASRSSQQRWDVLVVGLGGMGSSAAYHLARRGLRVLGLEQFGPNHVHGSSHGRTRIYRTAYFEGAAYVPYVRRAQRLWWELQKRTGRIVIRETGGLVLGPPGSPPVEGALRSARRYRLEHRSLSASEVERRFPQFRVPADEVGVWERRAGVLLPETCIAAHLEGAVEAGAELHFGEPCLAWSARPHGVEVRTPAATYRAQTLVLAAGPWTTELTPELRLPLQVERQVVFWFRPRPGVTIHRPDRMPVFIWGSRADRFAYGLPDIGDGVKVASDGGTPVARPGDSGPRLRRGEAVPIRRFVKQRLRGLEGRAVGFATCLYTNAPDHNFLIGHHPLRSNVLLVSACSGHGFKFASVVGETVADLATGDPPYPALPQFDPGRFGPGGATVLPRGG